MPNWQATPLWRKSTRSGTSGCVECCLTSHGVLLRDSKDPDGPVLSFEFSQWTAFVDQIRVHATDVETGVGGGQRI